MKNKPFPSLIRFITITGLLSASFVHIIGCDDSGDDFYVNRGEACNVTFCSQSNDYEVGIGVEEIDELTIECIQGPSGATLSNGLDGKYLVTGTYKLGSFPSAKITIQWIGETRYSLKEDFFISASDADSFIVKTTKQEGGIGSPYLYVTSEDKHIFSTYASDTGCDT
jgi:hypothetical protein